MIAHQLGIVADKTPKKHGGQRLTQPDMALHISDILQRSRLGMELQGFEPIYLGKEHKELVNFENLNKLEKIEFARKFKKATQDQIQFHQEIIQQNVTEQIRFKQEQEKAAALQLQQSKTL